MGFAGASQETKNTKKSPVLGENLHFLEKISTSWRKSQFLGILHQLFSLPSFSQGDRVESFPLSG